MVGGPIDTVSLAALRAVGRHLLIDINQQTLGNDVGFQVDAGLLERERIEGLGVRSLCDSAVKAQIAADSDELVDIASPDIVAGIDVILRHECLSEYVTVRRAQAATRRVHVTLSALQTHLNGEIGLGVSANRHKKQCHRQTLQQEPGNPVDHGEASTLNVKE